MVLHHGRPQGLEDLVGEFEVVPTVRGEVERPVRTGKRKIGRDGAGPHGFPRLAVDVPPEEASTREAPDDHRAGHAPHLVFLVDHVHAENTILCGRDLESADSGIRCRERVWRQPGPLGEVDRAFVSDCGIAVGVLSLYGEHERFVRGDGRRRERAQAARRARSHVDLQGVDEADELAGPQRIRQQHEPEGVLDKRLGAASRAPTASVPQRDDDLVAWSDLMVNDVDQERLEPGPRVPRGSNRTRNDPPEGLLSTEV